jgi:transposase
LDVHAKTVVACLITKGRKEIRTFATMTDELLQLGDWLSGAGCTPVAIESTGVYWKPVFNLLEGLLTIILVNARHIKAVPGRKTDVRDCERIGEEVTACADSFVSEAVELLERIPGVGIRTAQTIVAEIGVDMERFPSAKHLASWAGVCPGNHESAGKRKSGQPTKGNQSLRTILVEAAWAATNAKGTFLRAKYQRLVKRRPKQKALGAIAHRLLVISYHLLKRRVPYAELGRVLLEQPQIERQRRRLVARISAG